MGAVTFFGIIVYMVGMLIAGSIAGIVFGVRVLRNHRNGGKTAWSRGAGIICIIISIVLILAVVAVGIVTVMGFNKVEDKLLGSLYTDTGIMLEWDEYGEEFSYEDTKYVLFEFAEKNSFWQWCHTCEDYSDWGNPVFNLKDSEDGFVDDVFRKKLKSGIVVYTDTFDCFCKEKDMDALRQYYGTDIGKDWSLCVYDGNSDKDYDIDISGIDINELNAVSSGEKKKLKDKEVKKWADFECVSSDGMLEMGTSLVFDGKKWCLEVESYWDEENPEEDWYVVCELPENIEKQLPHEFK